MLSEALVKNLQAILKEQFGEEVDLKEASEIGETLVSYFDLLAQMDNETLANEQTYEQPTTTR
jgi:hypothetical protein